MNILCAYFTQKVSILYFRAKPLRTPSNIFVINLALCDFVMMAKAPIFIYSSVNRGYQGHFLCQLFGVAGAFSGLGASATNAAIAYDRFRYNIKYIPYFY